MLHLKSVRFKRSNNTPWEAGIMVNHDEMIIDQLGKIVPAPIWSFVDDGQLVIAYEPGPFETKKMRLT
jgi:hypothetical protein